MVLDFVEKVLYEDISCGGIEHRVSGTGTVDHEIHDGDFDVALEATIECILFHVCQRALDIV